jgi:hypothetical protein
MWMAWNLSSGAGHARRPVFDPAAPSQGIERLLDGEQLCGRYARERTE